MFKGNARTVENLVSEAAFIAESLKHLEAHLDEPVEKLRKSLMSYVSWTPEKVYLGKFVEGHMITKLPLGFEAPEPDERCILKNDWLQSGRACQRSRDSEPRLKLLIMGYQDTPQRR